MDYYPTKQNKKYKKQMTLYIKQTKTNKQNNKYCMKRHSPK